MEFTLPKGTVGNVVLQLEFDTEFGTIVQCADMIVQAAKAFDAKPRQCDPPCQNGGVCQSNGPDGEGICKCGKNFKGD